MIVDRRGSLHTFWIDKRDQELIRQSKKLNHRDLAKHYRGAAIYRNESSDAGLTFGPDIKVADHSCECCRIALTLDATGRPAAMWRHVFEPNLRDHAFWRWLAPNEIHRASEDGWQLDACPHHGPAIALASDGGFHAVWYGERKSLAAVRYGRLSAEGLAIGRPLASCRMLQLSMLMCFVKGPSSSLHGSFLMASEVFGRHGCLKTKAKRSKTSCLVSTRESTTTQCL
jgi:hypothetical protein